MIYFDNGATTFPKPGKVVAAVEEALVRYGANPGRSGHELSIQTAMKVYGVREDVASLFGVQGPENVIFTANCTHAVNMALKGTLRQGDHAIISDLEHNAILRPLHTLAQRGLISYSVAETFPDTRDTVESFRRHIGPKTRVIACTHASNVFGIRLPVAEIGALCRQHGILFLVDAAQTAGVLDIDAPGLGIDFLCAAGHKGLYGPSGTGLLITNLGSVLETLIEGGTGSYSQNYTQPRDMPDRLESGTLNTPGILGLGAGVSYVTERGCADIYLYEMKLAAEIFSELSKTRRVKLYTPDFDTGTHLPVISFNIEGLSSEETTARLSEDGFALRGGLHCAPLAHQKMGTLESGTARISIGAFNTADQAELLLEAIKKTSRYS